MMAFIIMACMAAADPIVLDNGALRVEVDPQTFSIRFVGVPSEANFVEPLYVPHKDHVGTGWVDPGGITADIEPAVERDAALRRGPAEVIERTDHGIVLLGPVSESLGIRLKKAIEIHPAHPTARYTVTVLSIGPSRRLAIRNTVRVPLGTTLRVARADGIMQPLESLPDRSTNVQTKTYSGVGLRDDLGGEAPTGTVVTETPEYWLVAIPPAVRQQQEVWGAHVPKIVHENRYGVWERRIADWPADGHNVPHAATFLCLLDEVSASYGAVLQGATAEVTPAHPVTFTETWTFRKGGQADARF